jgi:hypothetical protein
MKKSVLANNAGIVMQAKYGLLVVSFLERGEPLSYPCLVMSSALDDSAAPLF